jgi:RHS repeat-associated protein
MDGSPATVVKDDGTLVSQNAWDPYGQPTKAGSSSPGQTGSPLGFGGALKDGATGSLLLGARAYDPKTARFTTPDYFIAGQLDVALGSDSLTGNRYLYAAANPVGFYENGYWPSLKSIAKHVVKAAKAVASNRLVRSVAIGVAAAAVVTVVASGCAASFGLGCAIAAGALAGGVDALTTCKKSAGVASCVKHVAIGAAVGGAAAAATFGAGKMVSGRIAALAERRAATVAAAKVADAGEEVAETLVHGNSRLSSATAYLYRLEDLAGNYLKTGITNNPAGRYTQSFMEDKFMRILTRGTWSEMLNLERFIVELDPGPSNFEPWARAARSAAE